MIPAKVLRYNERMAQEIARSRKKYELAIIADWRYEQFFNFLQLSPSYRLAHLVATGKIDRAARARPADFDLVEETYAAFGDVTNTYFWKWWVERAQFQFGVSVTPRSKPLLTVGTRESVTLAMIQATHEKLDEFVMIDRPAQGNSATLILAIPLHNDRKALLKEVASLIDQEYGKEREQKKIAPYHMTRNKIRQQTLIKAQEVVWGRAARPKAKLFVVGNITNVSPSNWSDPKLKRDKVEANKRETMEALTSRHLNRAYTLAENAARGKFPSLEPLPPDEARPKFNYKRIQMRLIAYMKYLREEMERLKIKDAEEMRRRARRKKKIMQANISSESV